jgi:hypothetical protein
MFKSLLAVMVVLCVGVGCKGEKGGTGATGAPGADAPPSESPQNRTFRGTSTANPFVISVGPWEDSAIIVYYAVPADPDDWREVRTLPADAIGSSNPWYEGESTAGTITVTNVPVGSAYRVYMIPFSNLSGIRGIASIHGE